MSWEGLGGGAVALVHSDVESRRFGLGVSRLTIGDDITTPEEVAGQVTDVLAGADDDLVIVRYPTRLARLGAAVAASGRTVLPADVLLYWEIPADRLVLNAAELASRGLGLVVPDAATPAWGAALAAVVEDSFRGYGNHYTANPRLDPDAALAGYLEWAGGTFERNPGDVVILTRGEEPLGIATLSQSADGHDLEILLAGLVGASQGQGLYRYLLQGVGEQARLRGCSRVIISTQASNIRVQRAWASAGFKPFAATTTVHAMQA